MQYRTALRQLLVILSSIAIGCPGLAIGASPHAGPSDLAPAWPQAPTPPANAPNIVIVLLDDVGFGATSTFGGPVYTPALDELAKHGLRYNRFHVSALCSPTRAALLSGRNDHRVGFGTVVEDARGFPGLNGVWKKNAVAIAEVLRRAGYSTAAFGKWHNTPMWEVSPIGPFDRWPTGLGFEYFYGFMNAAESEWEPALYRNTTPVDPPQRPEQGYYFTTDIVDEAIHWLQTHSSLAPDKPYFLYFASGATHDPHQVPADWIAQYRGHFDQGWDALRGEIYARQKRLGVIPPSTELTPRPAELPAWNSLPADERLVLTHQMEVYAGFLAETDHEVGRLLEVLRQLPHSDNTLIFYIIGDNGAAGEAGPAGADDIGDYFDVPTVESRVQRLDQLGGPKHWNNYSAGWAWALDTPFQWMKLIASHLGGTRDPLIVSWPARITDGGGLRTQFIHVTDVVATIYAVTGIRFAPVIDGVKQLPLDGVNFAGSFRNASASSQHHVQIFEQWGNRAIYEDGWIAAARHTTPWGDFANTADSARDRWELYHIDQDFSEAHDLASQNPGKLRALQRLFDAEARRNNVYPLRAGAAPPMPSVTAGRHAFTFYPGMPRLPPWSAPDFRQSHRITANVVIPDVGAEGVIISDGGRHGGFVLYVKNDHLIYENNLSGTATEKLASDVSLPRGAVELTYEFVADGPVRGQFDIATGTGRLYVNGNKTAEGKSSRHTGIFYGGFDVGEAHVSPVSAAYRLPFQFTGTLNQVRVELR